jgi:hypothetical protein
VYNRTDYKKRKLAKTDAAAHLAKTGAKRDYKETEARTTAKVVKEGSVELTHVCGDCGYRSRFASEMRKHEPVLTPEATKYA